MTKILFVCTYHGGRAMLAEQIARSLHYPDIEVASSSFEQGEIGPRIYHLLAEKGLPIKHIEPPVPVWDRFNNGERFDLVVTLCNDTSAEKCPVFNANISTLYGRVARIVRWSIPDLANIEGNNEQWVEQAREIRDLIFLKVVRLLQDMHENAA